MWNLRMNNEGSPCMLRYFSLLERPYIKITRLRRYHPSPYCYLSCLWLPYYVLNGMIILALALMHYCTCSRVHCSAGISNYFVFTIQNHLPLHSFGVFPPHPLLQPGTRLLRRAGPNIFQCKIFFLPKRRVLPLLGEVAKMMTLSSL